MNLLLFTGYSCSGKSTLALELNKRFSFHFLGEREILHDLAIQRGYTRSRYWLLTDGYDALLVAARGETLARIGQFSNQRGIVLDGVYDRSFPQITREEYPSIAQTLIYIEAPYDLRIARMAKRLQVPGANIHAELLGIDAFKRKSGTDDLIAQADIKVDNSGELSATLTQLQFFLKERSIHPVIERE